MNIPSMQPFEVEIDLRKACDFAGASFEERALVSALYNLAPVSEVQAAQHLDWEPNRLRVVSRRLDADRRIGAGLRRFLIAYAPKKNLSRIDVKNGKGPQN